MDPSTATPAVPALQVPLGPLLGALSLLGAWLALRAYRSRTAGWGAALLYALLPAALWLLVASLNPEHPTRLVLTPFGTGIVLGFASGLRAVRGAARRADTSAERSFGCYLWSCAGALLGARAVFVAEHLALFSHARGLLALHAGGFAMNGGLLAAAAVSAGYFRAQPLRWRAWLDGLSPALGLALAFGSFGAYLQDPTRPSSLWVGALGLALSGAASAFGAWQRFHGQCFVLTALGYGIAQLSIRSPSSDAARAAEAGVAAVAAWLVIALALAAGWAWHKAFTFRRI